MTAMMIEDRKCVAAAGAGVEGHAIQIAESRLIARDILITDLAKQTTGASKYQDHHRTKKVSREQREFRAKS